MAIAHGASTHITSTSQAFTTAGSDRVMDYIVLSGGGDDMGATYNGVALTKKKTHVDGAGNRMTILTLVNPTTGSNTLVTTGTSFADGIASYYTGAGAVSGENSGTNSSTEITVGFTVAVDQSWVISGGCSRLGPHNPTPSTGVTNDRTSGATLMAAGDSGPASIGTVNHRWLNGVTNNENTIVGVVIEPATAAAVTRKTLALLGVA